jgi:hypothetical protein
MKGVVTRLKCKEEGQFVSAADLCLYLVKTMYKDSNYLQKRNRVGKQIGPGYDVTNSHR